MRIKITNDLPLEEEVKPPIGSIHEVSRIGGKERMKRKRFIKLMMAKGYSRNEANEIAELQIAVYGAYYKPYVTNICPFPPHSIVNASSESIVEFGQYVRQLVKEAKLIESFPNWGYADEEG